MTDVETQASLISDLKERSAALDPTKSFIVKAPAGSGKTELLTRRLLVLLSKVNQPEDILTVTFTRKAAREMKSRVLDTIRMVADGLEVGEEKRSLANAVIEKDRLKGWNLLENPERLNIGTIDSFCSRIAAQMPILSEIGPLRSIAENPTPLYKKAAHRIIDKVEEDTPTGETVRFALSHMDNSIVKLVSHMINILSKRDQWARHVGGNNTLLIKKELEESLKRRVSQQIYKVFKTFPEEIKEMVLGVSKWAAKHIDKDKKWAEEIISLSKSDTFPRETIEDLPLWSGVGALLLKEGGGWRKAINKSIGFPPDKTEQAIEEKENLQKALNLLASNKGLEELLHSIRSLPTPQYSEKEWKVLEALLKLLPSLEREVKRVLNEEKKIDFIGIAQGAIDALGTDDLPTDILLNLDMKLQHILIDEYQDTSRTHLSLIKKLTLGWEEGDGRTLFIVGDPMQSIYLFREAEVGLFINAWERGIGDISLNRIILSTNFRSAPEIVEWVNKSFTPEIKVKSDPSLGIVEYSPSATCGLKAGGEVTSHIFSSKDNNEETERAVELIKKIKREREEEEIAILVRSRSHLKNILPALKREGIKYSAQKIDRLSNRQTAQDIYSLLKGITNIYDTVSWLSILRAPWCGLSLEDLKKLTYDRPNTPIYKIILDELGANPRRLSSEKRERLKPLVEQIGKGLKLRGRIPIRKLIEGVWLGIGGASCVGEVELKDTATLFSLMDNASEGGNIIDMETFDFMVGELYSSLQEKGEKGIKIMTIHDSKGLEFDNVIIPHIGAKTRSHEKDLFIWLEDKEGLTLAPIGGTETNKNDPIYTFLREIRQKKENHEIKRLLYVATTRAKKGLYLFGNITGENPIKTSLLNQIWGKIDCQIIEETSSIDKDSSEKSTPKLKPMRLKAPHATPSLLPPLTKGIKEEKSPSLAAGSNPAFGIDNEVSRNVGTVIHRYLNRISKEGINRWNVERIDSEKETIISLHRELGSPSRKLDGATERSLEILKKTISDERGQWILTKHTEASSELPVSGIYEGNMVHGIIDRTFVDNSGVRYIIDYKTSSPDKGKESSFFETEKNRYFGQLFLYTQLLVRGGEKREIKNALFFPCITGWIEWGTNK